MPANLKTLFGALGVVVMLLAVPSVAAAETFVVNTTVDTETLPAECGPGGDEPCVTLRGALDGATAGDTISFAGIPAGSVIEVEEAPLPTIFEGVTIDGDTAAGATAGVPAVELVPINFDSLEFVPGLSVRHGEGTRIEGLAIGGFGIGIEVGLEETGDPVETEICGNYIGVQLNGEVAEPNAVGVEVLGSEPGAGPEKTEIGGTGCAGNTIAGNSRYGVVDAGLETTISGNSIGVGPQPFGTELPNGSGDLESAGVFETATASKTMIGGANPAVTDGNLIWFNDGPGVLVEATASEVSIRHDSFLENAGRAIEIPDRGQAAPTIAVAASDSAEHLRIEGSATGTVADETITLEFFASRSCDLAGNREGQTYLGSGVIEEAAIGSNAYGVDLFVGVPADERAITATATRAAGATTEFSECFRYTPFEPSQPIGPPPSPPGDEPGTPPTQNTSQAPAGNPPTEGPVPTNGEKVVVKPEEGKVLIKLPGTKKFVPLKELKEIPVGAVIDATKGRVLLTSIDPDGTEQSAEFFGGVFKVKQRDGAGLVVLELLDTVACPATGSSLRGGVFASGSSAASPRASGKLWGSGHGSFRTEGNDGSATVRGTIWLVEDRCDGTTFFKTRRGVVSVRDFVAHKTLPLPAGETYLAGSG